MEVISPVQRSAALNRGMFFRIAFSQRQCDPVANGIDLSLLEHVSPIEWDNVVLYGQYILDRKLVRQRRRTKRVGLSV
jgi:hypothetical protein